MPRHRQRQRQRHRDRPKDGQRGVGVDLIGDDLLQIILSKLPALSFASAACVSRSWNTACNRILSRPKLSSSLSLNPSLEVAVKEVLDQVLSEPIRPQFAIVWIDPSFSLQRIHNLIVEKLGSGIPVITSESNGIIGQDTCSGEFKEVQWYMTSSEDSGSQVETHGIILTVGFLPGLKVDAVPLFRLEEPRTPKIDSFVRDIREFTSSVSGFTSPAGIIMFADLEVDMKTVLDKMDYAMSKETFIVGGEGGKFLYERKGAGRSQKYISNAVALIFARDRNKPHGVGEIEFHVALSTGLSPIGPTHKVVSVREMRDECTSTWLTAKREGSNEILDGQTMLSNINDELGDRIEYPAFYIGVIERRKCFIGLERVRWVTSLAFHEVMGGDEEYLYVNGIGIKTGDSFHFYQSDSSTAESSCRNISENFRCLKGNSNKKDGHHVRHTGAGSDKMEAFGSFIFSCCGRGESFFGRPNVDSSPLLENFAGIPLAGTFCSGEIGRASLGSYSQEAQEGRVSCCLHFYSTAYLVMSYTPVPEQ